MVANKDEFKKALLSARDKKVFLNTKYLDMLKAQYSSKNHTITATQLAESVGYKNFNTSNLQYGTFGHAIADELGYIPPKRKDGTAMWYLTLSESAGNEDEVDEQYEFMMRKELVEALEEVKWVRKLS